MPIYRTTGHLTGYVNNVEAAQEYLTSDDMTQFLDPPLDSKIERIQWSLDYDGHSYEVEAIARVELSNTELKELSSWVSGQNSDGLGEGFEQQPFAENGEYNQWGELIEDSYEMVSFDWETNDSTFVRVV